MVSGRARLQDLYNLHGRTRFEPHTQDLLYQENVCHKGVLRACRRCISCRAEVFLAQLALDGGHAKL